MRKEEKKRAQPSEKAKIGVFSLAGIYTPEEKNCRRIEKKGIRTQIYGTMETFNPSLEIGNLVIQ